MGILIGAAVFLVWYLVGLLTGILLINVDERNPCNMDRTDILLLTLFSVLGPIIWSAFYTAYRIDTRGL